MNTSYMDWVPEMTLDDVFKSGDNLQRTSFDADDQNVYWLEGRADGTRKIMTKTNDGVKQITPDEYNVRSRVHEYGGHPFFVHEKKVYFSNYSDGRLYQQNLEDDNIHPLTPEVNADGTVGRYVAPKLSPNGKYLIFVYEKASEKHENPNYIGILDLSKRDPTEPEILISGSDFYGAPVFAEDDTLVWTQWSIPNMPWQETTLHKASFDSETGKIRDRPQILFDKQKVALLCPRFVNGKLFVIADFEGFNNESYQNWFNIYQIDLQTGDLDPVTTSINRVYGGPQWGVGPQRLSVTQTGNLVAQYYSQGKSTLVVIDPETKSEKMVNLGQFEVLNNFIVHNESIIVEAGSYQTKEHLRIIDLNTLHHELFYEINQEIQDFTISKPEFMSFPTSNNETAYCYLYLPTNKNYQAPKGEVPPCLVKVHGGPTGRTSSVFNINYQFFTSQGFAIIDIDHRGSTGYGRQFRDKLETQWGVVEMEDVKNAILHFRHKSVISDFVTISGGSAGGYSVQRALTMYPDLFAAGASYFGIGNLFTLFEMMETNHKFELYYGVYLFGGMPNEIEDVYRDRSPLFSIDKLQTPMIIFQGEDDRVVHPENSREIAEILEKRGIKHKYIEYSGEGHGFRQLTNKKDALDQEVRFYKEVYMEKM